jgi:GH25 family lysozyme M1 (1,4-beta-N-acetylmuramidase)
MQTRNTANFKGVDISHNNIVVDFNKLKQSGIQVAMMKASEGSTLTDPMLTINSKLAWEAGILQGFYHFLHIYKNSTIDAQVANFLNAIKGLKSDCLICVDVEGGGYHDECDPVTVTVQTLQFADLVKKATGIEIILYSNTDYIKNHFTNDITRLKAWLAYPTADNAPLENGKYNSWVGFQHSWTGSLNGVNGDVDLDEFTKDILIPIPAPKLENIAVVVSAPQRQIITLTVNGAWNVRSGASSNFGIIRAVGNGTKLEVFADVVNGWYKLTNHQFISASCVAVSSPAAPTILIMPVVPNKGTWTIFQGPDNKSKKLGKILSKQRYEVYEGDNGWCHIKAGPDYLGYVDWRAFK